MIMMTMTMTMTMMTRITILAAVLAAAPILCGEAPAAGKSGNPPAPTVHSEQSADAMRLEGERRFHANCGRCHAAPHKFPPRMMATVVRHMRVRATITDEDMRLVLFYMTQ
jgi:mono/diheme cytochrome c family protein